MRYTALQVDSEDGPVWVEMTEDEANALFDDSYPIRPEYPRLAGWADRTLKDWSPE